MTQEQLNATRTFTAQQMLEWRASLIDRCIQVVKISECRFERPRASTFGHGKDVGARHQLKASIAALELYKAGPKGGTP